VVEVMAHSPSRTNRSRTTRDDLFDAACDLIGRVRGSSMFEFLEWGVRGRYRAGENSYLRLIFRLAGLRAARSARRPPGPASGGGRRRAFALALAEAPLAVLDESSYVRWSCRPAWWGHRSRRSDCSTARRNAGHIGHLNVVPQAVSARAVATAASKLRRRVGPSRT